MTFNETIFLYELDQELSREEMYNNNTGMFSSFIKTFREVHHQNLGKKGEIRAF